MWLRFFVAGRAGKITKEEEYGGVSWPKRKSDDLLGYIVFGFVVQENRLILD